MRRKFGLERDRRILNAIEDFHYLTSFQIAQMFFQTVKDQNQRLKKTNERLKKLYDCGCCKRIKVPNQYTVYTVNHSSRYNSKIEHYLTIADIYIQLSQLKPAGASLNYFVEKKFDNLITDLYLEYRNDFRNDFKNYFIEVEINSSGDLKNKITKYSELFYNRALTHSKNNNDVLCIVYKRRLPRIDKNQLTEAFGIDINIFSLEYFSDFWKW